MQGKVPTAKLKINSYLIHTFTFNFNTFNSVIAVFSKYFDFSFGCIKNKLHWMLAHLWKLVLMVLVLVQLNLLQTHPMLVVLLALLFVASSASHNHFFDFYEKSFPDIFLNCVDSMGRPVDGYWIFNGTRIPVAVYVPCVCINFIETRIWSSQTKHYELVAYYLTIRVGCTVVNNRHAQILHM